MAPTVRTVLMRNKIRFQVMPHLNPNSPPFTEKWARTGICVIKGARVEDGVAVVY